MIKHLFNYFVLVVLLIIHSSCNSKPADYSKWKVAVASVYKMWAIDGSEVSYKYYVLGSRYTNYMGMPIGTVYGDKYLVLYNPEKPSESVLGDPTPFFYETDSVLITEGVITGKTSEHKVKDKFCLYFRFKYSVNGRTYERGQNSSFCTEPTVSIKEGMKFKVKYSVACPQSAVMILNDSEKNNFRDIPCNAQVDIDFLSSP